MLKHERPYVALLATLLCSILFCTMGFANTIDTPSPASGRNPGSTQQIIPADVLARTNLLIAELSQVRKALGKPKQSQSLIVVTNAAPREVYFEAQALFEKANRLAYEVTGSYVKAPEIHSDNLVPAHVWQLVDASLKRIIVVRARLGITAKLTEKVMPETTTPTDVFNAVLKANQELNALLYRRVAPSDVFAQVTLAINYTEQLLKPFQVQKRIPSTPAFVPDRTPTNVYKRLIRCIQLLQIIAKDSKIQMLSVKVNDLGQYQASPSDVFDLSKIIVSEVRYLSTRLPGTQKIQTYYPGYKTPSEVFQRAGILLKQLELLKSEVSKHPGWLENHHSGVSS